MRYVFPASSFSIRIGFYEREFGLLPLEGAHEIVARGKRITEREVRLVFEPE